MRGMDNNKTNDKKVRAARLRAIRKFINDAASYRDSLRSNIKTLTDSFKKNGSFGSDIYALGFTHPFGNAKATAVFTGKHSNYYMTVDMYGVFSFGWFKGAVKGNTLPGNAMHCTSIHINSIDERGAGARILDGILKYEGVFKSYINPDDCIASLVPLFNALCDNARKAVDILTGESPEARAERDAKRYAELAGRWFADSLDIHAGLLPVIDAANNAADNNALPKEWCLLGGDLGVVNPGLLASSDIPGSSVNVMLTFKRSRVDLVLLPKGGKPHGLLMFNPAVPHADHMPAILAHAVAELAEALHYEPAAAYGALYEALDTMAAKKNVLSRIFSLDNSPAAS